MKLKDSGIRISMDGRGCWRDNVFIERLWKSIQYEKVYLRACESVSQARASIGRCLDRMTPARVYFEQLPRPEAA